METFKVRINATESGILSLEKLVGQMWDEGWDPEHGDINLFARDFGSLFFVGIHTILKGAQVFRSETDLSHASLFWAHRKAEAFPFHRIYKRLYAKDGESLPYFFDGVKQQL